MIVDSSNDATGLVVDVLGTTSGRNYRHFETWKSQRNIINRYFQSLGWAEMETININKKTWGDGYGRERMFLGELMENRNMLTTNATARLHSIVGGVAVSRARSQAMMALIKRTRLNVDELVAKKLKIRLQVFWAADYKMPVMVKGRLDESFATTPHIELPSQSPYLLVVFTEGTHSQNQAILPFVSQQISSSTGDAGRGAGLSNLPNLPYMNYLVSVKCSNLAEIWLKLPYFLSQCCMEGGEYYFF